LSDWVTALVQARPYPNLTALHAVAQQTSLAWGEPELDLALSAHRAIWRKTRRPARACRAVAAGTGGGQRSGRVAHPGVNGGQRSLRGALWPGVLIRAKGRSGEEILQALTQRLNHNPAQEVACALAQLREITLLRLTGVIGE
jgi:2-oxo-4-hydroxy-4-carboxy-5-ureidoimidazoline decarboxylase